MSGKYSLELLEPRVMLSADGMAGGLITHDPAYDPAAIGAIEVMQAESPAAALQPAISPKASLDDLFEGLEGEALETAPAQDAGTNSKSILGGKLGGDSHPKSGVSGSSAALNAPATVTTTPGASVAIPFHAQALVAAGPVTLTFTASGGASLSWDSTAVTGLAINSGAANTVSLQGAPDLLNSYLSSGKLRTGGNGSVGISGAVTASITVTQAANSSTATALPTLILPQTFTVPTANGQISLAANALGTGTDAALHTRTVVISLSGAGSTPLTAASNSAVGLSAQINASTITLTGTEAALSSYLATAGNLVFNGSAGSYNLTVTVQVRGSGGEVLASSMRVASLAASDAIALQAENVKIATSIAGTTLRSSTTAVAVSERGFVYSLSSVNTNPTIGATGVGRVLVDPAKAAFEALLTGISAGRYTVRAYAVSNGNTVYSSSTSFEQGLIQEFFAGQGGSTVPTAPTNATLFNFLGDPYIASQSALDIYVAGGKQTTNERYLQNLQDLGDNYSERITGWLTVPTSGWYRFWANANKQAKFWIEDSNSTGMPIDGWNSATGNGSSNWNFPNEWNGENNGSAAQYLVAGTPYRFELLHSEDSNEPFSSSFFGGAGVGYGFFQVGYTTGASSNASSLSLTTGSDLPYTANLKLLPMSWLTGQQGQLSYRLPEVIPAGQPISVSPEGSSSVYPVAKVETFAGSGVSSSVDSSTATSATFNHPNGIVQDRFGNTYVATWVGLLRKISPDGEVTTIGSDLGSLLGLTIDRTNGDLYVTEENDRVFKYTNTNAANYATSAPVYNSGVVFAGQTAGGYLNAVGVAAKLDMAFGTAAGLAVYGGNLYVSDNNNDRIRVINLTSQSVSTLQIQGTTDGNTTQLNAGKTTGLAININTGKLYFGSQGQLGALDKVYEVDLSSGSQRLIATGLENADALTLDHAGRLYVASAATGTVYRINIQDVPVATTTVGTTQNVPVYGLMTLLAGTGTKSTRLDGYGAAARFNEILGLTVSNDGGLLVSDTGNHMIRRIGGYSTPQILPDGMILDALSGALSGLPSSYAGIYTQAGPREGMYGSASINNGQLQITPNANWQKGGLRVEGAGIRASEYRIAFDLITDNDSTPADGISYNFSLAGDPITSNWTIIGTGNGLTLAFNSYTAGGKAGIRLYYGNAATRSTGLETTPSGQLLAHTSNTSNWLSKPSGVRVELIIDTAGRATVRIDGNAIFSNVQLPADYLTADRSLWDHVFIGETGGSATRHAIDNLLIEEKNDSVGRSGSYSQDFATLPSSFTTDSAREELYGSAVFRDQIELTANAGGLVGGFLVKGAGVNSASFQTTFDLITSKTSGGADGVSYSFSAGGDASNNSPDAELGTGNGLTLSFRTYDSEGSSIRLYYGNAASGRAMTNTVGNSQLLAYSNNNAWRGTTAKVDLSVDQAGRASVRISTDGGKTWTQIFSNVQLPTGTGGYLEADRSTWNHIFKARTGASFDRHAIDDLVIREIGYVPRTSQSNAITITSITASPGSSPSGEEVSKAIDGTTGTKYLNMTGPGSGFTMSLSQPAAFNSLLLATRTNDEIWQWDPKTWEVYGSNGTGAAFADSAAANWVKLGEGNTGLSDAKGATSVVSFANATPYAHYKVVFPTTKGISNSQQYMHVSEARLFASDEFPVATVLEYATGNSGAAKLTVVTPIDIGMPAPSNLVATRSSNSITLTFAPPSPLGMDAVSGYQYSLDNGSSWTAFANSAGPYIINGTDNVSTYGLRLRAVSSFGIGSTSSTFAVVPAVVTALSLAPSMSGGPGQIPVTSNTPSSLFFTGLALDDGDGDSNTQSALTLTLSAPSANAVSITNTAASTTSSVVNGRQTLVLSGTASQLQTLLTSGNIRYTGTATGLTLELANSSGGRVLTSIALGVPSQVSVSGASAALSLPTTVTTTSGALVAIPFHAQALVAAGPVTITFTASGGASLNWDSTSVNGLSIGSDAANTVSLQGAPDVLNSYLSSGKLRTGGSGSVGISGAVTASITVVQVVTPVLSWANQSVTYGDIGPVTLPTATVNGAPVSGSFAFSSATTSVVSVSGATYTASGVGSSILTATFTPTDSSAYQAGSR
ncbi:MAG: hypothetical protein RIS24_2577 [Verrucomicrobiota bacterium]